MNTKAEIRFTEGAVFKNMLSFFFPLLGGYAITATGTAFNAFLLGRVVGDGALAASSAAGVPLNLVTTALAGLVSGMQIVLSKAVGRQDGEEAAACRRNGFFLILLASLLFTALCLPLTRPLLLLLQTPKDILDISALYLALNFAYLVLTLLYQAFLAVFYAEGRGRAVLFFNVLDIVLFILFDLLFVVALSMGLWGILAATGAKTLCGCIGCALFLGRRKKPAPMQKALPFRPERKLLREMLAVGLPISAYNLLNNIGALFLQIGINKNLGTPFISAMAASQPVGWLLAPLTYWGTTVSVFCGQNYGAAKYGRLLRGVRVSLLTCMVYAFFAVGFSFLFSGAICSIFAETAEIAHTAVLYTNLTVVAYPLIAVFHTFFQMLCGTGHSRVSVFGSLGEAICQLLGCFFLIPKAGTYGVCLARGTAWVSSFIIFTLAAIPVLKEIRAKAKTENTKSQISLTPLSF